MSGFKILGNNLKNQLIKKFFFNFSNFFSTRIHSFFQDIFLIKLFSGLSCATAQKCNLTNKQAPDEVMVSKYVYCFGQHCIFVCILAFNVCRYHTSHWFDFRCAKILTVGQDPHPHSQNDITNQFTQQDTRIQIFWNLRHDV